MRKAVFLDRDGVLNRLIMNPATGEFESPHSVNDLILAEGLDSLNVLSARGYSLFLISNQPSYAKGKCSLQDIKDIAAALDQKLKALGIDFKESYYCYHHPDSIVPELKGPCDCRKPKPFFVKKAISDFSLDASESWLIGDQDTDIQCGENAGIKTVLLETPESVKKRGQSRPTKTLLNLSQAVIFILNS